MKKQKEKTRPSLGDEVKDTVSGATGIVVAQVLWINGCMRCVVQSKVDKDGKVPDAHTFDEPNLEVIRTGAVPVGSAAPESAPLTAPASAPGGPIPTPERTSKLRL